MELIACAAAVAVGGLLGFACVILALRLFDVVFIDADPSPVSPLSEGDESPRRKDSSLEREILRDAEHNQEGKRRRPCRCGECMAAAREYRKKSKRRHRD